MTLGLPTEKQDTSELNDTLTVLTIRPAGTEKEAKRYVKKCHILHEVLDTTGPRLPAVSGTAIGSTPLTEPMTAEILVEQLKDLPFRLLAS